MCPAAAAGAPAPARDGWRRILWRLPSRGDSWGNSIPNPILYVNSAPDVVAGTTPPFSPPRAAAAAAAGAAMAAAALRARFRMRGGGREIARSHPGGGKKAGGK